jgi:carbonic anhydrase
MILISVLVLAFAKSAEGNYSYDYNGADWPKSSPECGLSNQSPIDLKTYVGQYEKYKPEYDSFNPAYLNITNKKVEWKDKSTKVALGQGFFESNFSESKLNATKKFDAVQFHFHAGSEHTVDG